MVRENRTKPHRHDKKRQPLFNNDDLLEAEGRRVPVCFCIDTSLSMNLIVNDKESRSLGKTISVDGIAGELVEGGLSIKDCVNKQLVGFYETLSKKSLQYGFEIALVMFDDVTTVHDFKTIKQLGAIPTIHTQGEKSYLGEGLDVALEVLEQRKAGYLQAELSYYQPFLIVMTDGRTTEDDNLLIGVTDRIVEEVKQQKLNLIVCSFTEEVPDSLKALQRGNEELRNSSQKGYGNPLFTMTTSEKIDNFFNYITRTVGGLS